MARHSTCPVLAVSAPLTELPRSIVAAVDFSPASIRAVQAALLIADAHAAVSLVHVQVPVRFARRNLDRTRIPETDIARLFYRLDAQLRPCLAETIKVQRVIAEGNALSAILERGRRESADLLVAGTHGPNWLERFFVGSTAVSLLHLASCAVLIAPAPPPAERVRLELGMSDTSIVDDPKDWSDVLAAIATRNRGRLVSMEVSGVLTAHAEHFILRDLAYATIFKSVEIRMRDMPVAKPSASREIGEWI